MTVPRHPGVKGVLGAALVAAMLLLASPAAGAGFGPPRTLAVGDVGRAQVATDDDGDSLVVWRVGDPPAPVPRPRAAAGADDLINRIAGPGA